MKISVLKKNDCTPMDVPHLSGDWSKIDYILTADCRVVVVNLQHNLTKMSKLLL